MNDIKISEFYYSDEYNDVFLIVDKCIVNKHIEKNKYYGLNNTDISSTGNVLKVYKDDLISINNFDPVHEYAYYEWKNSIDENLNLWIEIIQEDNAFGDKTKEFIQKLNQSNYIYKIAVLNFVKCEGDPKDLLLTWEQFRKKAKIVSAMALKYLHNFEIMSLFDIKSVADLVLYK